MRKLLYLILLFPFIANAQSYTNGAKFGAPIIRNAPTDKYATGYSVLLNGGHHSYATLAGRDSLVSYYPGLLRDGMQVYVRATGLTYRWNTTTNLWETIAYGDVTRAQTDSLSNLAVKLRYRSDTNLKDLNQYTTQGVWDIYPNDGATWSNVPNGIGYGTLSVLKSQFGLTQLISGVNDNGSGTIVRRMYWRASYAKAATPNVIDLTDVPWVEITPASGSVTSVTRGFGFQNTGTSITSTGTLDVDFSAQNLQVVAGRGNSYTGRLSTQGNDGTVYQNFVNQTTIPTPVSGQVNFGFVGGSPAWRNILGQRRLRTSFVGDADYYLPAKAQVQLVDRDSINTALSAKQNSLPTYASGQILYGSGTNIPAASNSLTWTGSTNSELAVRGVNNTGYTGVNLYNTAGALGAALQFGDSNYGVVSQNNLFFGNRISTGNTIFTYGTNGTEAMRIDSLGRVGIGIIPRMGNAVFNVAAIDGSIYSATTSTGINGFAGINMQNSNRVLVGSVQIGGIGTAAPLANNLFLGSRIVGQSTVFINGVSGTNEIARLDGNGRFGLGVSSPLAWVDIRTNSANVASLRLAASATALTPSASTLGGMRFTTSGRYEVVNTASTVQNLAYLSDITTRTPIKLAASATMVLNYDYVNKTATQYTLTLPPCNDFDIDGSRIITVLVTGTGGIRISVPSGYAMQAGSTFATTTGSGGATLTQGQKVQLIPVGTNSYYLQALNGSITVN